MSFKDKDHFSGHADRDEAFRPTYLLMATLRNSTGS